MKCFFCEAHFFDIHALLFGPLIEDQVKKINICSDCYNFLIEFKPTKKTWRDQYEAP